MRNDKLQAKKARHAIHHASVKLDILSQHTKCRQDIPACIAKINVYNGLQDLRTVDKPWESEEPNTDDYQSEHYNILGS